MFYYLRSKLSILNMRLSSNTAMILCGAFALALAVILYLLLTRKSNVVVKHVPHPTPVRAPLPQGPPQQPPVMQGPPPSQGPPPQAPQGPPQGQQPALVFFHMNGCGHCTHMKPAWEAASQKLASTPVKPLALEAGQHANVVKDLGIRGFPTIRYYPSGFAPGAPFVEYKGDRSVESLMRFAQSGGASA